MQRTTREFSIWLDAMRGLAALIVFLGHARVVLIGSIVEAAGVATRIEGGVGGAAPTHAVARQVTGFGHEAVIVFFVLSGYFVGGGAVRALTTGRWSASDYAIARMSRLWTVLIPVLLIGFAIDHIGYAMAGPGSIYMGPPGQEMIFPDQAQRMRWEVLVGNLVFLQTIVTTPFGSNSPLWTLAYEFFFYLAFPFLMFLLAPGVSVARRAACLAALAAIGLFVGRDIAFYFVFWLLGVLIQLLPKTLPPRLAKALAIVGSVGFVLLLGLLYKTRNAMPVQASDAIESIAAAALIYVIVHLRRERAAGPVAVAASGLAAMSYTLYLVHAPTIAFLSNLVMPVWRPWPVDPAGVAKFLTACAVVFAVAVGFYWLFERNTPVVRRWMTGLVPRRR